MTGRNSHENRKRILAGVMAAVCFCMAVLTSFEITEIVSHAGTFIGTNIWGGGSEMMFGHSRNYLYRWSDGYQMTFCISPGKHMGRTVIASGRRTTIDDDDIPFIKSKEDYERLALICSWFDQNGSLQADNATYAAAQTAVWAIMSGDGWDGADRLEQIVDQHVAGTYSRWQILKAYVEGEDSSAADVPGWLGMSRGQAEKNSQGMKLENGIWRAEFDISQIPQLAALDWQFENDEPGWAVQSAGGKLIFTYSGAEKKSNVVSAVLPAALSSWGRNTTSLNFYIPDGDINQVQCMISAGIFTPKVYLSLSLGESGDESEGEEGLTLKIYRHQETFEAHYQAELYKYCAETGEPLEDTAFRILEAFDGEGLGKLSAGSMTPRPAVWDGFRECAVASTDAEGRIIHTDVRRYEYSRTYCGGHPKPELLDVPEYVPDTGNGRDNSEEIAAVAAENEAIMQQWDELYELCSETTDFHADDPETARNAMLADRDAAYAAFIGLEYDYAFEETQARYGYMLHGQHNDDDEIPVFRTKSLEAGGESRQITKKVEINEYAGYNNSFNVGDSGEILRTSFDEVEESWKTEERSARENLKRRLQRAGIRPDNREIIYAPDQVNGRTADTASPADAVRAAETVSVAESASPANAALPAGASTELTDAGSAAGETVWELTILPTSEIADGVAGNTAASAFDRDMIRLMGEAAGTAVLPEPEEDDEPWVDPLPYKTENAVRISVFDHRTEGEIHINKRDMDLLAGESDTYDSYGDTQGDATLEGAVYGLYALEDIVHPDGKTGIVYAAGDLTAVATTDKNGDASFMAYTEKSDASDAALERAKRWQGTKTWIGHPLIAGRYIVMEISRSEGYELTVPSGQTGADDPAASAGRPEAAGHAQAVTAMTHPIDMHDGSWLEFDVEYENTARGFDILVSGYPEGASFFRSRMDERVSGSQVWVGTRRVETGEFERAEAGEYKIGADGSYIPKRDGEGNILYDTDNPVMKMYYVTRRLNYYPSGEAKVTVDPDKWADTSMVDPDYVKDETNAILKQMGYIVWEAGEDHGAPWSVIPLEGNTNKDLAEGICEWFQANSFWDSAYVNEVREQDGGYYAVVFHDYSRAGSSAVYEALTDTLYVKIPVMVEGMGLRHMYAAYAGEEFSMEHGYARAASVRQKDGEIPFGARMEDYLEKEYSPLYEQYEEGDYRLDGRGNKIPVYVTEDIYETKNETTSDYELTPLDAVYDPVSRCYRIHVENTVNWNETDGAVRETFRAVTKEKNIIWQGREMFYSDYLTNVKGVGVSAFASLEEEGRMARGIVELTYPGQISPMQDGAGTPGYGTRLTPAGVQECVIRQRIKVIKTIEEVPESTESGGKAEEGREDSPKLDNFRFKAYLKSNLERLYRSENGDITWIDRRGKPVDIQKTLAAHPSPVPDIFTMVPRNLSPLCRQAAESVNANDRLYEPDSEQPNEGYTALLETMTVTVADGSGSREIEVPNYGKFFDAIFVANHDLWDDKAAASTSYRPLGNEANRSSAAETNAQVSDMKRQFAIDWYLDDEVEMMSVGSTAYGDQFYDEALRRAVVKAENYLKPFFAYDLDEIYAVRWDSAEGGGADRDSSTLSADEEEERGYCGISAELPYGTYVVAEQQPQYAALEDFQNRHYRIDVPKEVMVPSVYMQPEEDGASADVMSGEYVFDSAMGPDDTAERYLIRFGEETDVIVAHNNSGDFEIYKYGMEIGRLTDGRNPAGQWRYFMLTQDEWKPYLNYYNDQDDRTAGEVSYYLSDDLEGHEHIGNVYRYSSVSEDAGTADGVMFAGGEPSEGNPQGIEYRDKVAVMKGMTTAYDGLYSPALVPWSPGKDKTGGSTGPEMGSPAGETSFARVRFQNTGYEARLRIEKLDSETHENLLHDDALFNIYAAKRDESPDGDGQVLFYEEDTEAAGSRQFLEAMGAKEIRQQDENTFVGVIPAGTPVCDEQDQILHQDAAGVRTGKFRSFSTARDGLMAGTGPDSDEVYGLQNTGYLVTPEPLRAGVYVLAEVKAPAGYVRCRPIAVEIYSDKISYYQEGNRSRRVAAAVYDWKPQETGGGAGATDETGGGAGTQGTENGRGGAETPEDGPKDVARIYVENAPTRLSVDKVKADGSVTYQISGRIDGSMAQIGGNPDYEYAYQDGVYMGYAWRKGTLEYLKALKDAGENVEIVYHGGLFAGYGYVTRALDTSDDENPYVAGALMTLYEGLELIPSGDTQDMAYDGLIVERGGNGSVTRMYVKEGYAGAHTAFVKEEKDGEPVWSAETVQRPDTDILFYDLSGLDLFQTKIIDGRPVTYAYDRNYQRMELEQIEEDKKLADGTDGGYSIFAFRNGTAVLELVGGDFTKISYSAEGRILEGNLAGPVRAADGKIYMKDGVIVYHLDEEGVRDSLVDPYTGMAYALAADTAGAADVPSADGQNPDTAAALKADQIAAGLSPDTPIRVLVWPVTIARDEEGRILSRDKITTSRLAAVGGSQETEYLTGTWNSENGEQSHAMSALTKNRAGQNMDGGPVISGNSGTFEKNVEAVYDEHGLVEYYKRSDETYETETALYDRSGQTVREKTSDHADDFDKAAYMTENGETQKSSQDEDSRKPEPVYHRSGEGYILENTWVTGDSAPDDPFSDVVTGGQADLLRRVPAGVYIMEELKAPDGYIRGLPSGVIVEETAHVQKASMVDAATKVVIGKVDGTESYTYSVLDMDRTDRAGNPACLGSVTEMKSAFDQSQLAGVRLALYPAERVYTSDLQQYPSGTYLRRTSSEPLTYFSTNSRSGQTETVTASWLTEGRPIYLEGIPAGEYLLEEENLPAGRVSAPAKEIVVTETRQVQVYMLYNDHTKIEIEKYTSGPSGDQLVNGAGFTLYEAKLDDSGRVLKDEAGEPLFDPDRPLEHFVSNDGKMYEGFIEAFEQQYRFYGTQVRTVSWTYEGCGYTAEYVSHDQIDAAAAGGSEGHFPTSAEMIFRVNGGGEIRAAVYEQKESLRGRDFTFEYQFDRHKLAGINDHALSYLTADGIRRLDYLPVGRAFVLVETETPSGFAGSGARLIVPEDTGSIERYRIENTEGALVIAKTFESGDGARELPDAKLALYRADENGSLIMEDAYLAAMWISGQDGVYTDADQANGRIPEGYQAGDRKPHTLKRLLEGVYWLTELESPAYYTTFRPVRIEYHPGDPIRIIRVSDTPVEGELEVKKTSTDGVTLSGAVFEVTAYRQPDFDNPVLCRRFSDSSGTAVIRGLPAGEADEDGRIIPYCYRLREIIPPDGYAVNPEIISFEFAPDRDGISYAWGEYARSQMTVEDERTHVALQKRDYGEAFVEGAGLAVYRLLGTDEKGRFLYDENAPEEQWVTSAGENTHILEGLTAGQTYLLMETSVPDGYVRMEPLLFTLSSDGRRISFISNHLSAVTIHDLYSLTISGRYAVKAEMTVTDRSGNQVASWISSGDGHLLTGEDGIQEGEIYTWTESVIYSDGSSEAVSRVTKRFWFDREAQENGVNVPAGKWIPDRAPERVSLRLYEEDPDAEDGRTIAEFEPKEKALELTAGDALSGRELFKNQKRYVLTETTYLSDGSRFESNRLTFETGNDGSIHAAGGYDRAASVTVSKTDITGEKEILGAVLQILDEDGQVVEEWVSGEKAHKVEQKLEPGREYTLRETAAPDGYAYASDITFFVREDGSAEMVVMEDGLTHVSVSKTDITGEKELPGARLQIADRDGHVVEEWVSGKEPHEITGRLTAGETYVLHEQSAPSGYAYAADIEFTVSLDGRIDRVVMKDEALPEKPHEPEKPVPKPERPVPVKHGYVQAEYHSLLLADGGVPMGGLKYFAAPDTGDDDGRRLPFLFLIMASAAAMCLVLWGAAADMFGQGKRRHVKSEDRKNKRTKE